MTENHALLIEDGKIIDIVAQSRIPADTLKINCADQILTAGFIDIQVNGGDNILFNNSPTSESAVTITEAHRRYGTTRLLLTCITDKLEITRQAIEAMRTARIKNPAILGIHIEGPHLSIKRRGVHKAEYIRALIPEDMQNYKPVGDEIILMTIAPENVTPQQIKELCNQGVIVSLGHTSATSEQVRNALGAGATAFTHLFNGMGGLDARVPGPAGIALDDRTSWCSIIADGYHISPEMMRIALRAKSKNKIFLVSDAMPPTATETPEPFQLYGETIHSENGRCINGEGNLAGSSITMLDAVRHCVVKIGVGLEESLRMASIYPAAFLGLDKKLGRLLPGFEADIIALDPALNLMGSWTAGLSSHRPTRHS